MEAEEWALYKLLVHSLGMINATIQLFNEHFNGVLKYCLSADGWDLDNEYYYDPFQWHGYIFSNMLLSGLLPCSNKLIHVLAMKSLVKSSIFM